MAIVNTQLKSDVARGREIHSRLIAAMKERNDESAGLLWQCWQERVISHLRSQDRKAFLSLKSTPVGEIGSSAYLAACFAQELQYLETLLNPKAVDLSTSGLSSRSVSKK